MTNIQEIDFAQKSDIQNKFSGTINALEYICQEAEKENLALVCLHLNIAIAELKDYLPPKAKTG